MNPFPEGALPDGFSLIEREGVGWLESNLEEGVVRFTLTRGSSGEDLDLGLVEGAGPEAAERATYARRLITSAMGIPQRDVRFVHQVHGGTIRSGFEGEAPDPFIPAAPHPMEADGLVTGDDRHVLAVSTADCAAVAVSGPRGRALLHCGWRGLGTSMIERAVELVDGEQGVIGPCIGPCCFEVGQEVADHLGVELTPTGTVDLPAVAGRMLESAGVGEVRSAALCTACNHGVFYSYRRQGDSAGRQMAFFSPI